MVRLSAQGESPRFGDLICDNYTTACGRWFAECANHLDRARVKGWHIYQDPNTRRTYILCPECVGQRSRLPAAPPYLPGQGELF